MSTLQVQRVFAILSLFLRCVFACDEISTEQTCSFTLHINKPLLNRLRKLFDRDSEKNIVEYNVRIRNDKGGFDLYNGSNPNYFQPWKWYRTQGRRSSHLLLTSDFYFGFLQTLLWCGIEKVDLNLDINPAECLQGAENKTMDILINFLLKDFGIGDHSPNWGTVHSDTVEICTALIDGYNGKGKLVYRCWSYNAEKKIICDDDSADNWAFWLNVAIITLSCLLVVSFCVKFGIYNNIGGKNMKEKSNNYILEHTYSFLLYHESTENTAGIKCVPSYVLDSMPNLKAKLDQPNGNYVVTVRKTSVTMPRNQLLGEDDRVHFLKNCFDNLCFLRDKKPRWKRFFIISAIMSMLFLPSIPFYVFMWWHHGWYQKLVDAFSERGLQGPFYFQWSCNFEDQTYFVKILLVLNALFAMFYIFTYTFWHCFSDEIFWKFSCKCSLTCVLGVLLVFPGSMLLLVATLSLVSFLVMLVFTMIVQANFWASIFQWGLTLTIYVINFYHDYFRPHNVLKSKVLKLFEKEPRLNTENTVSAITNETLDNALRRLGIDNSNGEQWSAPNIEFEIMSKHLQLKCKRSFLFLSEDGVLLITQDFLERCLKWGRQSPLKNCPKSDSIGQICKCTCLKFLHVLEIVLPLAMAGAFIVLVIIMVKAYSDLYYISPSNRFIASFITSLGPLFVQYFNKTGTPQGNDGKLDRRFHAELMKGINNYDEHLAVNDFTDFDVAALTVEAHDITPKLKYAIQDSGQECQLLLQQCCPC